MKVAYKARNIEAARRDLRLDPLALLMVGVVNIMPGISYREMKEHLQEVVVRYGGIEEALAAFRRGEIGAERVQ